MEGSHGGARRDLLKRARDLYKALSFSPEDLACNIHDVLNGSNIE